jgi:hypothetical protein
MKKAAQLRLGLCWLMAQDFYLRGNSFTIRKQPCYWASLFTAA